MSVEPVVSPRSSSTKLERWGRFPLLLPLAGDAGIGGIDCLAIMASPRDSTSVSGAFFSCFSFSLSS